MIAVILANMKDEQKRLRFPTAVVLIHIRIGNILRTGPSPLSLLVKRDFEKGFSFTIPHLLEGKVTKVCPPLNWIKFKELAEEFYALAKITLRIFILDRPIQGEIKITKDLTLTDSDTDCFERQVLRS